MFLIKKSTGFDQNIKFEENVNFDNNNNKIYEIVKFDETVQFDKNVNLTKMSTFPPPPPPHPLDVVSHFFWTKKKFWKTKRGRRLYHGIVTVVIWMLTAELATSAASR